MSDRILFLDSKMNMPAKMVVLPLRTTVVKTSSALIIISPVDFTPTQIGEITSLGAVTDIVAPSLIHYLFLERTMSLFPHATVWGPPGCEQKLPGIAWHKIFGKDRWPYEDEIQALFIDGAPRLNEIVFLDVQTETLIVGDLCFNLLDPKGWAAPAVLRLMGTYKKFAVSRLFNPFFANQKILEPLLQKLMTWDFNRVVMGHGEIIKANGKRLLLHALQERGYLKDYKSIT